MTCKAPSVTSFKTIGVEGVPGLDTVQQIKYKSTIPSFERCLSMDPNERPSAKQLLFLFKNIMKKNEAIVKS